VSAEYALNSLRGGLSITNELGEEKQHTNHIRDIASALFTHGVHAAADEDPQWLPDLVALESLPLVVLSM